MGALETARSRNRAAGLRGAIPFRPLHQRATTRQRLAGDDRLADLPGGPRILIGGNGPKRTLPLVARYADIWNGTFLSPQAFRERSAILDELLRAAGREPGSVRRTMMNGLTFGRDMDELDRRLAWRHDHPEFAGKSLTAALEIMHVSWHTIVGTPDMIVQQIKVYAEAGVEELMLQWFDLDDIDGLRAFAESVLPQL